MSKPVECRNFPTPCPVSVRMPVLKVCITPVGSEQDDVGVLGEMCDLKLFQDILLVNREILCLFSGNVSIVLSNNYSDIYFVHFCNSLSSGNSVIK